MTSLPEHVQRAYDYGAITEGFTLEDYLLEASQNNGYETVCIWGVQGSGKSNRMLQMGYWVQKATLSKDGHEPSDEEIWEAVLDSVVFRPRNFVRRLKEVPRGERLPCLLWDDIGCHYPSSKFKTDPKEYEAIDQTWAVIRTKVGVVIVTIPLINRLAKNIRDNLSVEVYLGRNQNELIKRIFYLPGLDRQYANMFKVTVEMPAPFNLYFVPGWVWERYWDMRLDLTDEALEVLEGTVDMEDLEGYIPVLEASEIMRAQGYKVSATTLQQNISRKVLRGRVISGRLCVLEEDFYSFAGCKEPLE